MFLTEYETTVVMRPDISGDAIESTLDKMRGVVSDRGGKLLAINHWGRKKLAYEVAKHSRGVYVHTHYLGKGNLVAEIERNFRISDTVLRFMTIKLEERVRADDRDEKPYEVPEYDAQDDLDEDGEEATASDEAVEAAAESKPADGEAPAAEAAPAEAAPAAEAAATETPAPAASDESSSEAKE